MCSPEILILYHVQYAIDALSHFHGLSDRLIVLLLVFDHSGIFFLLHLYCDVQALFVLTIPSPESLFERVCYNAAAELYLLFSKLFLTHLPFRMRFYHFFCPWFNGKYVQFVFAFPGPVPLRLPVVKNCRPSIAFLQIASSGIMVILLLPMLPVWLFSARMLPLNHV
ncbi:uncharacterized protein TM35_000074300 [Trypanosoma theileri]|uniref:Uncharacterized protein n=1 Tax=Trypanosoma theileri TaxID=67003 RepID=A0A1X0P235_9TRYP|nr:uncharacterized protein TM35_000074300 [Trypanosoma theileri]ORC91006.1 hypothetical protein TM35_000074300 [Trypanosoma theileri]